MKWFEVINKTKNLAELYIYGVIANEKWFPEDVTPQETAKELKKIGEDVKDLNIYINSPGGSVFAGEAIFNQIKRLKVSTTVYVDGLAASIASIIALAADKVVMPANAVFMIHNPSMCACGEADHLRKAADTLDKIKTLLVDTYVEKTGIKADKIAEMLDEETWMNGKEAVELGFADELEESMKVAACFTGEKAVFNKITHDLTAYKAEKIEKCIFNPGMSLETRQNHMAFELAAMAALI